MMYLHCFVLGTQGKIIKFPSLKYIRINKIHHYVDKKANTKMSSEYQRKYKTNLGILFTMPI